METLRLKCLPVMFLLSRISIFKFIRWLVNCLTVSAVLPLIDFSVGVEIVISVSVNFSWMKDFNWSNLFNISLDVNLTTSLVSAWIIKYFGCFWVIGSAWCRKPSAVAAGNFLSLTDRSFDKLLSITPLRSTQSLRHKYLVGKYQVFRLIFSFPIAVSDIPSTGHLLVTLPQVVVLQLKYLLWY